MKELICRIVGPDAQVADAYNQIKARMTLMTAIMLGQPGDRTSYARLESVDTGTLDEMLHIDICGIMRVGEYVAAEYPAWIQPTGAHDSYPALTLKGDPVRVTHNGQIWQNSHGNGNSWAPGAFGWTQVTVETETPVDTYPAWQAWSGINADLYQVGDRVTHNGQAWESTAANNHWEPGVYGWVQV